MDWKNGHNAISSRKSLKNRRNSNLKLVRFLLERHRNHLRARDESASHNKTLQQSGWKGSIHLYHGQSSSSCNPGASTDTHQPFGPALAAEGRSAQSQRDARRRRKKKKRADVMQRNGVLAHM